MRHKPPSFPGGDAALDDLHSWKVSVLAQNGLAFDLSTSTGKLMRTIIAGLAEF